MNNIRPIGVRAFCVMLVMFVAVNTNSTKGQCGDDDAGNCCGGTGTPGCSDEACCQAVCDFQPVCCQGSWSSTCGLIAKSLCPKSLWRMWNRFAPTPSLLRTKGHTILLRCPVL